MGNIPLHAALVHLPLGLAFILPILAFGLMGSIGRGWLTRRSWVVFIAMQALMVGTGIAAIKTGQQEEDRAEELVPEHFIHQHEESAEQLVWAAGIVLLLSSAAWALQSVRHQRWAMIAAAIGTLAVAGLAVQTGHAGGELVYVHGAAASYAAQAQAPRPHQPAAPRGTVGDDDTE